MKNNSWRNGLAVGLVAGSCTSIILLFLVSVLPADGPNTTSDWIIATTSALTVIVSVIAVLFVAGTLTATQETLAETKKIGLNQTRAWVLVKSAHVAAAQNKTGTINIRVIFCNFGNSPAKAIKSEIYLYNDPYPFEGARAIEDLTSDFTISTLPPGSTFTRFCNDWPTPSQDHLKPRIRIRFSYVILDDTLTEEFEEWVVLEDGGELFARPLMPVDRYISPKDENISVEPL